MQQAMLQEAKTQYAILVTEMAFYPAPLIARNPWLSRDPMIIAHAQRFVQQDVLQQMLKKFELSGKLETTVAPFNAFAASHDFMGMVETLRTLEVFGRRNIASSAFLYQVGSEVTGKTGHLQ